MEMEEDETGQTQAKNRYSRRNSFSSHFMIIIRSFFSLLEAGKRKWKETNCSVLSTDRQHAIMAIIYETFLLFITL